MREKTLKGSLTVEAAWIMAMVLLSIAVMLQQACRIHDETKAAMGLHEALEKGRHGSAKELEASVSGAQEHLGRLMFFPDCCFLSHLLPDCFCVWRLNQLLSLKGCRLLITR